MPNIRQLISLKEQYATLKSSDKKVKDFLDKAILENSTIQKSFNIEERRFLNESFSFNRAIPELIEYFESQPSEDVVVLFVDIANFSNLTEAKTNKYIISYLDNYYKAAFPTIYKYGGQIEKLMGDGIICVFGKPFIDVSWPVEFNRAELCAKELVEKFKGSNKEIKVALHNGNVTYYKTPGTMYEEYTMIGKPITEIFRLESVSRKNAINYYEESDYDILLSSYELGLSALNPRSYKVFHFDTQLQGVTQKKVRYIKFF